MKAKEYRIGIDVGGTNTDAVILDENLNCVAKAKTLTTKIVFDGINNALELLKSQKEKEFAMVKYAMLGTTHCTNAIIERRALDKVALIRLAAPTSTAIPPYTDWPDDLKETVNGGFIIAKGGYSYTGDVINHIDKKEISHFINNLDINVKNIAVCGCFSSVNEEQENIVRDMLSDLNPDFNIVVSNEIGSIGLLERENASILNASLVKVIENVVDGFSKALKDNNINPSIYICQNDGTVMDVEYAKKYPILVIGCGPTNSLRGAMHLSKQKNAIIVDVGGTTSDYGVIENGFPRISSLTTNIGGVRTNFRMPDIHSIGLGGGSIVDMENSKVGPKSVGYKITNEALIFGGETITATDVVINSNDSDCNFGDINNLKSLDKDQSFKIRKTINAIFKEGLDIVKLSDEDAIVVKVGGGSILFPNTMDGVSKVIKTDNYEVSNAIGAALSDIGVEMEHIYSYNKIKREVAIEQMQEKARKKVIEAGAREESIELFSIEEIPISYLPGDAVKVKLKMIGSL